MNSTRTTLSRLALSLCCVLAFAPTTLARQGGLPVVDITPPKQVEKLAITADKLHTSGPAGDIDNAVVLIERGKITAVGPASQVSIPDGFTKLAAKVATPGLIDARATVGLSGIYNTKHDSDQLERSSPLQPELRAIDAYNALEPLVMYLRMLGITTVQTGHAPGEVISGQLMTVKTLGQPLPAGVLNPASAIAVTISPQAHKDGGRSPGTRGKLAAMFRQELLKAREHKEAIAKAKEPKDRPSRDLKLELLVDALDGKLPMVVHAHRAQDIATALRLQEEFGFKLILDGGAESYLLIDQLKAKNIPVFIHPTMMRAVGETENASFTTAGKLADAGITVAMQSGYEGYVPKTRVVLFEGALAAVHGLGPKRALEAMTIVPAKLLGIDTRVGSIEIGKDADLALFDGDVLEYTTHCTTTIIDGAIYEHPAK
jgi:imidazolonepropionase-like amidohydrolase